MFLVVFEVLFSWLTVKCCQNYALFYRGHTEKQGVRLRMMVFVFFPSVF